MKQSVTVQPTRKKPMSVTSSVSQCAPSKKSSLIYKSIYLNMLDKSKDDCPGNYSHNRERSRDIRQTKTSNTGSKGTRASDNQLAKPIGNNSSLLSGELSVGLFNRLCSKGTLSDNFVNPLSAHHQGSNTPKVSKNTFIYQYIIGKGGFGKVWKVESKKNRQQYAMKQMLKSLVMAKKSVQSVINQRILLTNLNHPFVVNMHYAFQDRQTLFLVMDLMPGGDLRYHLGSKKCFSEVQAKFFIACLVLGLEYIHTQKIIHRDIKPENLVLDSQGYLRITDFGIARTYKPANAMDTSGTPGYMSPEVLCRQNHQYVSDYFAVGVIAYELMFGKVQFETRQRPYSGKTRKQIRDQVLAKQIQIKRSQVPQKWSYEAADFINRLIQRKPINRLGNRGADQVKHHPWLRQLNWKKLYNKEIESPFIPTMKKDNFDQDEQITIDDEEQAELIEKNALLLRKTAFQQLFNGYYHDEPLVAPCGLKVQTEPCSVPDVPFHNPSFDLEQYHRKISKPKDITPHTKYSHDNGQTVKISELVLSTSFHRRDKDKRHQFN